MFIKRKLEKAFYLAKTLSRIIESVFDIIFQLILSSVESQFNVINFLLRFLRKDKSNVEIFAWKILNNSHKPI